MAQDSGLASALSLCQRLSHMASLLIPTRSLFLAYSRHTHLYLINSEALASTDDLGKFSAAEMFGPRAKTAAPFFKFSHALNALCAVIDGLKAVSSDCSDVYPCSYLWPQRVNGVCSHISVFYNHVPHHPIRSGALALALQSAHNCIHCYVFLVIV